MPIQFNQMKDIGKVSKEKVVPWVKAQPSVKKEFI